MPELPEVETTMRGIYPFLIHQTIQQVIIREHRLRWPIPSDLPKLLEQEPILSISRRAKYIIIQFHHGHLLIHLGMSGHLKMVENSQLNVIKHDHVDFILPNHLCLRFHDPRRFGSILWTEQTIENHPLLKHLGPEPLSEHFNASYLYAKLKNKTSAIKTLIMNQEIVVGVGNIYSNEALFSSQIHPLMKGNTVTLKQVARLVDAIKQVLNKAIQAGGTTLNDFKNVEGKPGYFQQELLIYGKKDKPCIHCQTPIQSCKIGQRSTFFCPKCQTKK